MSHHQTTSVFAFALAVLSANVLPAQVQPAQVQPRQPGNVVQVQPGAATPAATANRAGWQSNDQTLATCVAIENQEEIAIAKFAQSKLSDKKVKEFAQMLIEDHGDFLKKLDRFAPEASRTSLDNAERGTTRNSQETTATQNQGGQVAGGAARQSNNIQQTGGTALGAPQTPIDIVQLHREIASQCLADTKKMLSDKDQDEFDKCFLGLQIAKHAAMQTKLTVLQRHTSGELAEILKAGSETTKEHLDEAEKLMREIADSSSSRSSKSKKDQKDEKNDSK